MTPAEHPAATVLVHPDSDVRSPGATRIVKIVTSHPQDWPWRRLSGDASEMPSVGADLSQWRAQSLFDVAAVFGHAPPPGWSW